MSDEILKLITVEDFRKFGQQKVMLLDNKEIEYILNHHTKVVNDFCNEVLPHLTNEQQKIRKDDAVGYLAIYSIGLEVRKAHKQLKNIKFDEKNMKQWIELLHKPLPELYTDVGQITVQIVFGQFQMYAKKNWNEQRYKYIYRYDSPLKWFKKVKEFPEIDSARTLLKFNDYQQIEKKVKDMLDTKMKI